MVCDSAWYRRAFVKFRGAIPEFGVSMNKDAAHEMDAIRVFIKSLPSCREITLLACNYVKKLYLW